MNGTYKVGVKVLKNKLSDPDEFVEMLLVDAPEDPDVYVYTVSDDDTHVHVTFDVYGISKPQSIIAAETYCLGELNLEETDFEVEYIEESDED